MDCSFISNQNQREMIQTAINAANNLELWNWFRSNTIESFMFSNSPNVHRMYVEIERLGYSGHSGASFGCTMRNIEFIAKNSFETFADMYINEMHEIHEIHETPRQETIFRQPNQ